ncbi:MAG TPA: hypothetical protein VF993_01170 [Myxococcales bacterium]
MRARIATAAALLASCTLIVEHQLSSQKPGGSDAGCDELIFFVGSADDAGLYFHGGVTAPAFRGPAYPTPTKSAGEFGTTLTFVLDGGLAMVGGLEGDRLNFRLETNWTPTWAVPAPGHDGPGGPIYNYGCTEVFGATYDSLRDRSSLQIIAAGCGDDLFYDGGTVSGPPDPLGPAIGWAALPDGGARIAVLLASQAQTCDETFPPSCFPPRGAGAVTPGADRRIDALVDPNGGGPLWIVSTGGGDTRLYDSVFGASAGVVSWAGPIAALAPDIGVTMRIVSGQLEAQLFDSTAARRGNEAHFDLSDSAAHGLEIARLGTAPSVRAAWIGGDGQARTATMDFSVATSPQLSAPAVVCGSQGATFAAPTSTTTATVLVGDSLYLRHAP